MLKEGVAMDMSMARPPVVSASSFKSEEKFEWKKKTTVGVCGVGTLP